MATEKQLQALARGRAKRSGAKGTPATGTAGPAVQNGKGSSPQLWSAALLAAVALVVLLFWAFSPRHLQPEGEEDEDDEVDDEEAPASDDGIRPGTGALSDKPLPIAGGDLVPWTGGPDWSVRRGQFVDRNVAHQLLKVGQYMKFGDCASGLITLDISREGGGAYPPHKSHQRGVDVDIDMRKLGTDCAELLQRLLFEHGFICWYSGPGAIPASAEKSPRHFTHLHARYTGVSRTVD